MEEISNFDIDQYYNDTSEYGGTFSKDLLPKKIKGNSFYIVNMQDSDEGGGTHWVSVINLDPKEIIYFDSFGVPSAPKEIEKFIKTTNKKVVRNLFQLQHIKTSSCGPWSIYFIDGMLTKRKFKDVLNDFTMNPVINEHILLKYFGNEAFTERTLKQSIKNHQLKGQGIKEIQKYIKGHGINILDTAMNVLNPVNWANAIIMGRRKDMPPNVREFLSRSDGSRKWNLTLKDLDEMKKGQKSKEWMEEWINSHFGSKKIVSIQAFRQPIVKAIDSILNVLSFGTLSKAKQDLHIDELFHLYTICTMENGRTYRIEKNQVVNLYEFEKPAEADRSNVYYTNITWYQMFKNAEELVGPDALWLYRANDWNCQHFTSTLFRACHQGHETEAFNFINQPTQEIFDRVPKYVNSIANAITNLAGRADRIFHGSGKEKKDIFTDQYGRKYTYDEWLKKKNTEWFW
jgi:hypothetical protein